MIENKLLAIATENKSSSSSFSMPDINYIFHPTEKRKDFIDNLHELRFN